MAWSMPTTNQWASGMAITPDMNSGNYTAEQWAAMQQQHWQQWAQWQQQYATWQSQYGSKYAEQMQALQSMGGMPPLPPAAAAPPPAPPPPDKPPPPPHENNQPLYGNAQHQPTPVMAPGHNNVPASNITDNPTGNIQNRSYATDTLSEVAQSSLNSEALKMLAEEEKAFDIQFQKWEEEIENWKKANVNHPDKKAYEQYEEKFETCRARLLERRQQMKLKRAKLMGITQQPPPSNVPRPNLSVPPPAINTVSTDFSTNKDSSNYQSQNFNKNVSQISTNVPQKDYRREYNTNFDPQDRYESYVNTSNISVSNKNLVSTEPFLHTTEPSKGIPGLDLVPESDKFNSRPPEIVDITDDSTENHNRNVQREPDYSKISKGINNILGDEKIMNILSMVRGQNQVSNNTQGPMGPQGHTGHIATNTNDYWDGNETQNNNFGMSQGAHYNVKQKDYSMQHMGNQGPDYTTAPPRIYRQDDVQQGQYPEGDQQFNSSMQSRQMPPRPNPPRHMQQNVRPNAPMRSLMDPLPPQNDFPSAGYDRRTMQEGPPGQGIRPNVPVRPPPPARPSWVDEPLFTPSVIVEYEHKPLRLKARDFIEPVHTFDYNHQSKDSDVKRKDFKKEIDGLFAKNSRSYDREDRYSDRHRDLYYRDHDRTLTRDHLRDSRDDHYSKGLREDYGDRRRYDDDFRDKRYDDRRRDDRDKFIRREDLYRERDRERDEMPRDRDRDLERIRDRERDLDRMRDRDLERGRERDKEIHRDRPRDYRRSRSHDKDSRKRGHSKDSEPSSVTSSKKVKDTPHSKPKHMVMIDDILEPPGRQIRPEKIVIILRGPPGSGKSYLAKLIREREAEYGGTVRVMSIDDYFMQEGEIEEKDPTTGKIVKKPSLKYEYDENQEENYIMSLKRAFKRTITDGYFTFLIYDAVNDQLRSYADIWNFARQNNFQVYICTMDLDSQACYKRNIHNRKLEDIEVVCSRFFPTPDHHIQLDPTTLLQSASIPEVQMEDVDDDIIMEDAQEIEVDKSFTSKWEKMDDAAQLARLDGTSKPLRPSQFSMEDYLQLDDWKPNTSKPGKKTVRWADIEERRQQEKMRAIGFVVGQTDWNRMTDPTMGSSALTQTKYIERVRRT